MSDLGPSCGYCQMNPCDHDGLWREYHDMERALREKDARLLAMEEALSDAMGWLAIAPRDGALLSFPELALSQMRSRHATALDALPKETE